MAAMSRDEILARKVHGRTEQVPFTDGSYVVVRGLSRGEAREVGKLDDLVEVENQALAYGLVEPALTLAEVQQWTGDDESGEVQKVVDAIQRLSGTAPGQAKELTKSVPG